MPKQPRWGYKRQFDEAIRHLMAAGDLLLKLGEAGYKDHPQFSDDMKAVFWHVLEAGRLCEAMRDRI